MTIIGLTGGIAAGKSTAAEILREFGATVIDADRLGHRSYEPGTPGFQKVVNAFGHDIVAKDGTIDRRILGGKVFGAPGQLERLNAIVWPEIRALIQDEVKQIRSQDVDSIIVLEAAVLLEAGWEDLCDEVWVVVTPVQTAVDRLKERNGLSEDAAMARINAQMSNKERTERAAVKIENSSTEDQLRARVERAWKALVARTGKARPAGKATKTGSVKASDSKPAAKPAAKAAARPAKSTTTRAAAAARPATTAPAKAASKAAASKASARAASGKTSAAAKAPAAKAPAAKATSTKATSAKAPASKVAAKSAGTSAKASARPAARPATKAAAKPAAKASKAASTSKTAPAARAAPAKAAKPAAASKTTVSAKAAPKQSSTASKSTSTGGSKSSPKASRAASGRAR